LTVFVHKFDFFFSSIPIPTEKLHPKINFKLVGIGGRNTINNKGWRLKTFSTHLRERGHSNVSHFINQIKVGCH
jgi:hypothetical protein